MHRYWKTMLSAAGFALAVLYLGGSAGNAAIFVLFLAGFLLPASFVVWLMLRNIAMEKELLSLLSFSGAIVIAVPWWYLRKRSGLPFFAVDLAVGLLIAGRAMVTPGRREFFRMLRQFVLPREEPWLGLVLPALFCSVWLGFEVRQGGEIRYHGLFPVDFCNLSAIVSLLKASPGMLLGFAEGQGVLHYHWFFFTFPALLSTFLGVGMSSSHALVLGNLITAIFLFKTLSYVNARILSEAGLPSVPMRDLGAGLTILAASVMHFYYGAASLLNLSWLSPGLRNGLLLALPHGLTAFGNNTFALVLCLLFLCCLEQWRVQSKISWVILAAVCSSLVAGYSITLCFSLGLIWVFLLGFRQIREPRRVIAPALIIGVLMFLVCAMLGFFSGGTGSVALDFDHGQYVRNVLFSFPVLIIGAALATRFLDGWWPKTLFLGLAACLIVPSFLYIKGSPSGAVDFSMKTGSLFIALGGPVALYGYCRWRGAQPRSRVVTGVLCLLLAGGLLHTAAYAGQFAYYRLFKPEAACEKVDADYFDALTYIRRHSRPTKILIDGSGYQSAAMYPALLVSERRLLFADSSVPGYTETGDHIERGKGVARKARWEEWAKSGFLDTAGARYFAALADYLITKHAVVSGDWVQEGIFGEIHVYKSTRNGGSLPASAPSR